MKGRKPKPTRLKVIAGNPGKRPLNENEPEFPPDLPEPPEFLLPEARAEWDRIAGQLFAQGVLTSVDRGALAVCCQGWGRAVQAESALAVLAAQDPTTFGLLIKTRYGAVCNPLVAIAYKSFELYLRTCTEFGMTPSSRSRINTLQMGAAQLSPEVKSWLKYSEPLSRWPE